MSSQPIQYDLDPMHSGAHFSIRHLMMAQVRGQFTKLSGTLDLDSDDISKSQIDITIDIDSVHTGQPAREQHLKTADFFDVAQYPNMTFRSTRITQTGPDSMEIVGDLSLHGHTNPVTLHATGSTAEINDMWGSKRIGFSAETKINRAAFGMTYNAPLEAGGFVLGEDVDVNLEVEFARKSG